MNDDFRLFGEAGDGGPPVDADVALITAYLARELSLAQIVAVEERLASDTPFRNAVTPIIDAWSLSDVPASERSGASRSWVLTPAQRSEGWQRYLAEAQAAMGTVTITDHPARRTRTKWSVARIAAAIALVALPLLGTAQAVRYVIGRVEASRALAATGGPASRGRLGRAVPCPHPEPCVHSETGPLVEGRPTATLTPLPAASAAQDSVPPTLSLVGELRIGDPAHPLFSAATVRVGPHGQLLVPQQVLSPGQRGTMMMQPARLLVFDSTGALTTTISQGGTGTFAVSRLFGWVGDSVWISDGGGRGGRPTITFGPAGTQVGVTSINIAYPQPADVGRIPTFTFSGALARYADGTLLVSATPDSRDRLVRDSTFPGATQFVVIGPDGMIQRILGRVPYGDLAISYTVPGQVGFCADVIPFPNPVAWAVSPDGSRIGTATATIRSSDGGELHLTVIKSTGDTLFARTVPFSGIPIDPVAAQHTLEAKYAEMAAGNSTCGPNALANYRAKAPALTPLAQPPIKGLVVGRDGTLWLDVVLRGWSGVMVFDPKGNVIGRLHLPPGAILAEAERGRIWVIEQGGTSVMRYRVDR